jgi:hypothetical protein
MGNTVKEIATAMKDINLLSSYELSKEKVLSYAEKLFFLYPKLKAKMVEDLMTDFFLNKVEYFPTKGIRNFTENLEKRNVRGETSEQKAYREHVEQNLKHRS